MTPQRRPPKQKHGLGLVITLLDNGCVCVCVVELLCTVMVFCWDYDGSFVVYFL